MISINDPRNSLVIWLWRDLRESKERRQAWASNPNFDFRNLGLITTLIAGLMLMNHEAAAQQPAQTAGGLTCNINGIPLQKRVRYWRLGQALRQAVQERQELPDGYAFQMDTAQIGTGQLVEWIELERQCCPFFGFEVRWSRQNGPVWLHLTGPEGIKDFILDGFRLR
jgi:hypothetical protein